MFLKKLPSVDINRNQRVKLRNDVVAELADKYSLSVMDLYSVVEENIGLLTADGVHPNEDLYNTMADYIVKQFRK